MLISDTRSLVAGRDNRTEATGNVVGRLSAPWPWTEIPRTDKVSDQRPHRHAGRQPRQALPLGLPQGLPIGRVVDVIEEPGDVVKTALVQPEADLEHLEHVLVITDDQGPSALPRTDDGGDGR